MEHIAIAVKSLRSVQHFATPLTLAHQALLSSTISSCSLLKFISIDLMMLFNHLILICPFLLPSVSPSIRVFSNESALCITWPKYWSSRFSTSLSNVHSGLISFNMDWFNLLVVQFSFFQSLSRVQLLWPPGKQHNRLPYLSPTPGTCSNSCPLSQWCHPTISSSIVPFSSCLQSFPASGSFPMS